MTCFIIDLDGTILNVQKRNYACYLKAVAAEPLPLDLYWQKKVKREPVEFSQTLFQAHIEDADLLALDTLQPLAKEWLEGAHAKGHRLILATRRHKAEAVEQQLEKFGLIQLFQALVVNPEPDKASSVLDVCSINPIETVWIGDTEDDALAAQKIGCAAWLFTSGMRDAAFLASFNPQKLVTGFDALLQTP